MLRDRIWFILSLSHTLTTKGQVKAESGDIYYQMFFNFINSTLVTGMECLCKSRCSPNLYSYCSFISFSEKSEGWRPKVCALVQRSHEGNKILYFCSTTSLSSVLMVKRWFLYLQKWFPFPRRKNAEEANCFFLWGLILVSIYICSAQSH